MKKEQRSKPEQKRVRSLKLNKETLRQLETGRLKDVAGGTYSHTYCPGNPCRF
jgi:hypothetical protein